MADEGLWAKRVSEWKASGQSLSTFVAGREFSASALRYWSRRLEETRAREKPKPRAVRLARLVRVDSEPIAAGREMVIEIGRFRLRVGDELDRETLRAVVEVLSEIETSGAR